MTSGRFCPPWTGAGFVAISVAISVRSAGFPELERCDIETKNLKTFYRVSAILGVVISSLVFWAFMLSQKEKGPAPLRFIVLNLFVGLSCALPAYFWAAQSRSAQG